MRPTNGGAAPTVAETLALAEAWNERAALLSTLAFELSDLFGATWSSLPPAYLIRRLSGGASAPNPELVDDVRAELMHAAKRAREEAARLLGAITDASLDGSSPALDGDGHVAPRVRFGGIKIPEGGEEIAPNPECAPARRKLGSNWPSVEEGKRDDRACAEGEAPADESLASITTLRPRRWRR